MMDEKRLVLDEDELHKLAYLANETGVTLEYHEQYTAGSVNHEVTVVFKPDNKRCRCGR